MPHLLADGWTTASGVGLHRRRSHLTQKDIVRILMKDNKRSVHDSLRGYVR